MRGRKACFVCDPRSRLHVARLSPPPLLSSLDFGYYRSSTHGPTGPGISKKILFPTIWIQEVYSVSRGPPPICCGRRNHPEISSALNWWRGQILKLEFHLLAKKQDN